MCEKLRQLKEKARTFTPFGIGKDRLIESELEKYLGETTKQFLARKAHDRVIIRETKEDGYQIFPCFEDYIEFMDKKKKEEEQHNLPNFASNEDLLRYEEERKKKQKEQITLPNGLTVLVPEKTDKKPSWLAQQLQKPVPSPEDVTKIKALRTAEIEEVKRLPQQGEPSYTKPGYKKAVTERAWEQISAEVRRRQGNKP